MGKESSPLLEETKRILRKLEEMRNMRSKELSVMPVPVFEAATNIDITEEEYEERKNRERFFIQYGVEQGCNYRPVSKTSKILPPGLYRAHTDEAGNLFVKESFDLSELIRFPDTIADDVIDEFDVFWEKKPFYDERGEPHKRGFMLWGPPGGGKTSTVSFIMKEFIEQGGIVFNFNYTLLGALRQFRIIEPDRKIMVIMEDVDSLIKDRHEEQAVLEFLDGSVQHSNTIIVATTNYPEHLPDRIINRPSRFDRISYIGCPSERDRKIYLKTKAKTLSSKQINVWSKDTVGWTLAHLKELILSVEVFGLKYNETVDRLNAMRKKIEDSSSYERELRGKDESTFGFSNRRD